MAVNLRNSFHEYIVYFYRYTHFCQFIHHFIAQNWIIFSRYRIGQKIGKKCFSSCFSCRKLWIGKLKYVKCRKSDSSASRKVTHKVYNLRYCWTVDWTLTVYIDSCDSALTSYINHEYLLCFHGYEHRFIFLIQAFMKFFNKQNAKDMQD